MAFNYLFFKRRRQTWLWMLVVFAAGSIYGKYLLLSRGPYANSITEKQPTAPESVVPRTYFGVTLLKDVPAFRTTVPMKPAIDKKREQKRREETERMSGRLHRVDEYCARYQTNDMQLTSNKNIVVSKENNFLHCAVTKAASTFWSRFLMTLNRSSEMSSPYSMPLDKVMAKKPLKLASFISKEEKVSFIDSAFRNLFVRDPFTRMLSAYVDKVFAPNPTYWRMWGKAIRYGNTGSNNKNQQASATCGSNLTFAQVMGYANDYLHVRDMHFISVYRYCQPCQARYHFIGKMETFSQDLDHLSRFLNLSIAPYLNSPQFRADYAKDAIEDSINSPFSWMQDVLKCMDKQELGLRVWRKLQIRGLISRRIPFPYTPEAFQRVTASELIQAALDAWSKSTDREELRRQKRDAFLEAYSTVDVHALSRLTEKFQQDFEMFDYDPRPSDVFEVPENITRGAFDWRKQWVE